MNKGKFASLIMLGVFSAGVASSSAVSAQGDSNLASVVKSASSRVDSVSIDPKVSNEPMVDADETNIDAETTTDEDNNASADTEILDKDIEDKADLSEVSAKQNSKNKDEPSMGPTTDPSQESDNPNEPVTDPTPKSDNPDEPKKEEKGGFGVWKS